MVEWWVVAAKEARPLCSASLLSGPVRCTAAQYVNPQCIQSSCTMYSVDAQCALYDVICRCRNAFCGVLQAAAPTSWPLKGWMGSEALRPLAGRAGSGGPARAGFPSHSSFVQLFSCGFVPCPGHYIWPPDGPDWVQQDYPH